MFEKIILMDTLDAFTLTIVLVITIPFIFLLLKLSKI